MLAKLRQQARHGVAVPALYALDWEAGWLLEEWVHGCTVRSVLDAMLEGYVRDAGDGEGGKGATTGGDGLRGLMARIGRSVGKVHECGVVHGDLTTSNLMVRRRSPGVGVSVAAEAREDEVVDVEGEVVLIDFGLAATSLQEEDRAVDLYVLERAFGSTHPAAEGLFREALRAYGESYADGRRVLKRLEEVRMRGRKKIMIG